MNSPGHRAIIIDCEFADAGFSVVSDGEKMTVAGDFGDGVASSLCRPQLHRLT